MSNNNDIFEFIDQETRDSGFIGLRKCGPDIIGIVVSLKKEGDIEIFVKKDIAIRISEFIRDKTESYN